MQEEAKSAEPKKINLNEEYMDLMEAAEALGVSYPGLCQTIREDKLKNIEVQTLMFGKKKRYLVRRADVEEQARKNRPAPPKVTSIIDPQSKRDLEKLVERATQINSHRGFKTQGSAYEIVLGTLNQLSVAEASAKDELDRLKQNPGHSSLLRLENDATSIMKEHGISIGSGNPEIKIRELLRTISGQLTIFKRNNRQLVDLVREAVDHHTKLTMEHTKLIVEALNAYK